MTRVLALGSGRGSGPDTATALRTLAGDVLGGAIAHRGHLPREEQPEAVIRGLTALLGRP